jgi:SAM-dependent methyltransferase
MREQATFADGAAWRAALRAGSPRGAEWQSAFQALRGTFSAEGIAGVCDACARPSRFQVGAEGSGPSWRESLRCARCGANARQRAAAAVLLDGWLDGGLEGKPPSAGSPARIYLTEQAGPFYRALRRRLPGLVGSEFAATTLRRWRLQGWLWRHGLFERLHFADVTALPFADAGFDAAMSLDVLEHVPDFRAALREFARELRPGGRLVLTVPFHAGLDRSETIARAEADGRIAFLGAPEYHGDPLGGGVPCFHHFGWDLLGALRAAGFGEAVALHVHDPARGLPEPLWVLRATR